MAMTDLYNSLDSPGKSCAAVWTQITLCSAENPNRLWQFRVLESTGPVSDEAMEKIVDAAVDEAGAISEYLSIVFLTKSDYDNFGRFAYHITNRLVAQEEGCTELCLPCSIDMEFEYYNLSYILVDSKSWNIIKWEVFNSSCDVFPEPPVRTA